MSNLQLEVGEKDKHLLSALSKEDSVLFSNAKKSFLSTNWLQLTYVGFLSTPSEGRKLLISSFFAKTQLIERGVLMGNVLVAVEVVRNTHFRKGIDISEEIKSAVLYQDAMSKYILKHDKRIEFRYAMVYLVVFSILVAFFYLISKSYGG